MFPKPPPTSRQVLRQILDRARVLGPAGAAVFDLDSTLINNTPRQAQILREIGELLKVPALAGSSLVHWGSSWDVEGAMERAGLDKASIEVILPEVLRLWEERFFTDAYCVHDVAAPGAVAFLRELRAAGSKVVYCTGRPSLMRQGTVESFLRFGFPAPDDAEVHLEMKPVPTDKDDEFKRRIPERLNQIGTVFAAFDNEPTHINSYRLAFPSAFAVHLATDHSGRDVVLEEGVVSVPDFELVDPQG